MTNEHSIDFDGRNHEITPTLRKTADLVLHPRLRFWVLELPPVDVWPQIVGHFPL